jgi:hypothetical protein
VCLGASAFMYVDFDAFRQGLYKHAQNGGAGLFQSRRRAHQNEERVALLSGQVQTAQRSGACHGGPAQQGTTGIVFQYGFSGPQRVRRSFGGYPEQSSILEAPVDPAMVLWGIRRTQKNYAASGIQLAKRGLQQGNFADAGLPRHELYKRPHGPAIAGKLGVQRWKTRGESRPARLRQLCSTPQRRVYGFRGLRRRKLVGEHFGIKIASICTV